MEQLPSEWYNPLIDRRPPRFLLQCPQGPSTCNIRAFTGLWWNHAARAPTEPNDDRPQSLAAGVPVATILFHRYPRAARLVPAPTEEPGVGGTVRHLNVDEEELNLRFTQSASVLTRRLETGIDAATTWAAATLRDFPGAVLAAAGVPGGCLVLLRDERRVTVTGREVVDPMVLASAVYAALLANRLTDGSFTLLLGAHGIHLSVSITPPEDHAA
jgi:hypothetical protein